MITMILNIFSDHFDRYLVTNGTDKMSVFPKFSIPPVLLNLWTLTKYNPSAHFCSLPSTRYLAEETAKIDAYDPGQSQNHGSMPPPQRYFSRDPVSHHEVLTSGTSKTHIKKYSLSDTAWGTLFTVVRDTEHLYPCLLSSHNVGFKSLSFLNKCRKSFFREQTN